MSGSLLDGLFSFEGLGLRSTVPAEVGNGSCRGTDAYYRAGKNLANDQLPVNIGSGSCRGQEACFEIKIPVSSNAYNCDQCCDCFKTVGAQNPNTFNPFIADGECNVIGERLSYECIKKVPRHGEKKLGEIPHLLTRGFSR